MPEPKIAMSLRLNANLYANMQTYAAKMKLTMPGFITYCIEETVDYLKQKDEQDKTKN